MGTLGHGPDLGPFLKVRVPFVLIMKDKWGTGFFVRPPVRLPAARPFNTRKRPSSGKGTKNPKQPKTFRGIDQIPYVPTITMTETEKKKKKKQYKPRVNRYFMERVNWRGRKPRRDLYRLYGAESTHEGGGTVEDANVVTIGHGIPVGSALLVMVQALWRRLYEKTGFELLDWDGFPHYSSSIFQVEYRYTQFADGVSIPVTITFGSGLTHNQISLAIRNEFLTQSVAAAEVFRLQNIKIVPNGTNAIDEPRGVYAGELNLSYMPLYFRYTSVMTIQNRTPGNAPTDDQSTDISNNPLTGRWWQVAGNEFKSRGIHESGLQARLLDSQYGTLALAGNPLSQGTKVLGPTDVKLCRATKRLTINPGRIVKSRVAFYKKTSVNYFLHCCIKYLRTATGVTADTITSPMFMGKSKFFQFEKICDTRTVGEQNVTVGYENAINLSCRLGKAMKQHAHRMTYVQPQAAPPP